MTTYGKIYQMVEEEIKKKGGIVDWSSSGYMIQALEDILPKIQQLEPVWIPVEERLPEVQEWVWFHKLDGESCEGRLLESGDFEDVFGDEITPTHWMPLPLTK